MEIIVKTKDAIYNSKLFDLTFYHNDEKEMLMIVVQKEWLGEGFGTAYIDTIYEKEITEITVVGF